MQDWIFWNKLETPRGAFSFDGLERSLEKNKIPTMVSCRCSGINLQDWKSELGYIHSPTPKELETSSEVCKLCRLILESIKRSIPRQAILWGTYKFSNLLQFGPVKLFAVSRSVGKYEQVRQGRPLESTLVSQKIFVTVGEPGDMRCDDAGAQLEMYAVEGN